MPSIRRFIVSAAAVCGGLALVPAALAHHSFAPHFDSKKPVNIAGTITRLYPAQPHRHHAGGA